MPLLVISYISWPIMIYFKVPCEFHSQPLQASFCHQGSGSVYFSYSSVHSDSKIKIKIIVFRSIKNIIGNNCNIINKESLHEVKIFQTMWIVNQLVEQMKINYERANVLLCKRTYNTYSLVLSNQFVLTLFKLITCFLTTIV